MHLSESKVQVPLVKIPFVDSIAPAQYAELPVAVTQPLLDKRPLSARKEQRTRKLKMIACITISILHLQMERFLIVLFAVMRSMPLP